MMKNKFQPSGLVYLVYGKTGSGKSAILNALQTTNQF